MKLLLENWRKYIIKESSCGMYRTGMCDAFALAKHELTGLPIYLVQGKWREDDDYWATEPCHMVVSDGDSFIDVGGRKTEEDLKQNCYFSGPVEEVEIIEITPEEAREIFTVEGVHDEDIERAKEYIQNETPT